MAFNPNSLNQSPNSNRENFKEKFLAPFDERKVIEAFNNPAKIDDPEAPATEEKFAVYEEKFGDYLYRVFKVATYNEKNRDLVFELSKDPSKKPPTELIFRLTNSETYGKGYDIMHRIAQTQAEGISGSTFLKKAESYIRILKENSLIDCNYLMARSPQPKVTDWFLKNGYVLGSDHDKEVIESFTDENSEEVFFDFKDHILDRDPGLVKKDAFNDPEFTKYLKVENGRKIWSISLEEATPFWERYFPSVVVAKILN